MVNTPALSFLLFFSLIANADMTSKNIEVYLPEMMTIILKNSMIAKPLGQPSSCAELISRDSIIENPLGQPSSCAELCSRGNKTSGVYNIYPKSSLSKNPIKVYCDMDTDGGGWTVFQRRGDFEAQENFFRNWSDYRRGFGNLEKDFWLGNDNLYILTNQDLVMLRIDLEDFEGNQRHAVYKEFHVTSSVDQYRLIIGNYSGDAGDSLEFHHNKTFVTYDHNDKLKCSERFKGGWWYHNCHYSNLNGLYLKGNHTSSGIGVNWYLFKGGYYSLMKSEMKFRPIMFRNCDEAV